MLDLAVFKKNIWRFLVNESMPSKDIEIELYMHVYTHA